MTTSKQRYQSFLFSGIYILTLDNWRTWSTSSNPTSSIRARVCSLCRSVRLVERYSCESSNVCRRSSTRFWLDEKRSKICACVCLALKVNGWMNEQTSEHASARIVSNRSINIRVYVKLQSKASIFNSFLLSPPSPHLRIVVNGAVEALVIPCHHRIHQSFHSVFLLLQPLQRPVRIGRLENREDMGSSVEG